MKSFFALLVVVVSAWIGFNLSDPVFDSAAHDLCVSHAEENGLDLVETSGEWGWCEFEDRSGNAVFIDENDQVMDVTAKSRGLRLSGWALIVGPVVGRMAIAGSTGLLKKD